MPALLERAHDRLRDLLVDAGEDLRQRLEDRDLGAGVDEERRELATDRAAADHRDARRDRRRAASTSSDDSTRSPSNAKPSTASARGDEPVAISTLRPRIIGAVGDADRPAVGLEHAGAGDDRDLAALQQRLEPGREPVDDASACGSATSRARSAGAEVSTPNSAAAAHRAQHLGGLQQLLGRDAAPVQARAADPLLLDDGDVHARAARRRARRRSRPGHHRGRRDRSRQARHVASSSVHEDHLEGERNQDRQAGQRRENDVRAGAHGNVGRRVSSRVRMHDFRTRRG